MESRLGNAVPRLARSRLFHDGQQGRRRTRGGRPLRGRRTSWRGGRDRTSRIVRSNPRADCVRNGVRAWPRRCPPPRNTGLQPTCVAFGPNFTDFSHGLESHPVGGGRSGSGRSQPPASVRRTSIGTTGRYRTQVGNHRPCRGCRWRRARRPQRPDSRERRPLARRLACGSFSSAAQGACASSTARAI